MRLALVTNTLFEVEEPPPNPIGFDRIEVAEAQAETENAERPNLARAEVTTGIETPRTVTVAAPVGEMFVGTRLEITGWTVVKDRVRDETAKDPPAPEVTRNARPVSGVIIGTLPVTADMETQTEVAKAVDPTRMRGEFDRFVRPVARTVTCWAPVMAVLVGIADEAITRSKESDCEKVIIGVVMVVIMEVCEPIPALAFSAKAESDR